jgi:hypothetical protein
VPFGPLEWLKLFTPLPSQLRSVNEPVSPWRSVSRAVTKAGSALDVTVEEVVISARKKVVVFAKSWTQYAHDCRYVDFPVLSLKYLA